MPIGIEEFDDYDPDGDRETNAEWVFRFLVQNRDSAFKPGEIADATGVHENSI